jgi:hypothetical protein
MYPLSLPFTAKSLSASCAGEKVNSSLTQKDHCLLSYQNKALKLEIMKLAFKYY